VRRRDDGGDEELPEEADVNLYSYFAHEIHRERLDQFEREAELRRILSERTPRQLPRVHLPTLRRRPHARPDVGAC
jgi:hypothetical protein